MKMNKSKSETVTYDKPAKGQKTALESHRGSNNDTGSKTSSPATSCDKPRI